MSTDDEDRAELAQRVGHALSEFIDDQAPLNERYYVIGAKHVLKKFGLVEQAPRQITDEQVKVVAEKICDAFPHEGGGSRIVYEDAEVMARIALEAALGGAA